MKIDSECDSCSKNDLLLSKINDPANESVQR